MFPRTLGRHLYGTGRKVAGSSPVVAPEFSMRVIEGM